MRSLISLLLMAAVVMVACGNGPPSVAGWREQKWRPLVEVVPEPAKAEPAVCEEALPRVRELSEELQPAPDPALGDAAAAWLRQAETLVFECASEAPEQDYQTEYQNLTRLGDEVESLLTSSLAG